MSSSAILKAVSLKVFTRLIASFVILLKLIWLFAMVAPSSVPCIIGRESYSSPLFLIFFDFYSVLYTHYEGLNRPNYYNVASYHIFFIAYKQADL